MSPPTAPDTLQRILERLSQGFVPKQIIEEFLPHSPADAMIWARRLLGWEEHGRQCSAQAVAIARVISLRAMRAFSLVLTGDGRVVQRRREGDPWPKPEPSLTFRLTIQGEELRVEYTPDYFPDGGQDVISFVSLSDPPEPHCLSLSGILWTYVPHDAIVACGGPETFAALFAEARLRGEGKEFEATFKGEWPEAKQPRRRQDCQQALLSFDEIQPSVGEHSAQVIAEKEAKQQGRSPRQPMLFDELD